MSFKVVFIGSSRVGKTSVLQRLTEGKFLEPSGPSTAPYLKTKTVVADGLEIQLQLWDTPGLEEFRMITEKCYNEAHAIISVFDLTDQGSFDDIKVWLEQIKLSQRNQVCKMILGNKCDLLDKRVVDKHKIQDLIKEGEMLYFDVSAKTGENVEEVLKQIAIEMKRRFLRPKVLVVGNSPCGKTCFIQRLTENYFSTSSAATLCTDFKTKTVMIDGSEVKFHVWDTPGVEKLVQLTKRLFKSAQGIIIMIDLTNQKSFDDIKMWLDLINNNDGEKACKIIIGNKSDFKEERAVDRQEIKEFVKEVKLPYFEVSAYTGENVEESFLYLAKDIKRTFFSGRNDNPVNNVGAEDNIDKNGSKASECNLF